MLPEFDTSKFYLGVLCLRRHDWQGVGQSLRYKNNLHCVDCKRWHYEKRKESNEPIRKAKEEGKRRSKELLESHGINTDLYRLGKLCKRSHDWNETGQSLRFASGGSCVLCHRELGRAWEKRNPELVREMGKRKRLKNPRDYKEYYYRNLEKERARGAKQYVERREQYRTRARRWYLKNRDLVLERSRLYQQTPTGRLVRKAINGRRRAVKLRTHLIPYGSTELNQHFAKFNHCCAYCGSDKRISADHLIPLSKGGPDCLGNIVPACLYCNSSKNASDALEWYQRQPFYDRKRWQKILEILGKDNPNQIPLF
jgi:hypothetical protein